MKLDKLSSDRLNILRFPLVVCVVYVHAYNTEVGLANGVIGSLNVGFLFDFLRNLISQGFARTAVPLFFLISGYLFFAGFAWSLKNYRKKIYSRVKTLLVPFLFWNVFTLILFVIGQNHPEIQGYFSGNKEPISTYGVYDYFNAVLGIERLPISYQFWFIRDLIIMVLLAPLMYVIIKNMPHLFFVGIFVLWFIDCWPLYIPNVEAVAFFYAGAYFAKTNGSLYSLDRYGIVVMTSYFGVLLLDALTKLYEYNIYIHKTGVLIGVLYLLVLSKTLAEMRRVRVVLLWAGGCSFFVFCVHEPLLMIVKKITYKLLSPNSDIVLFGLYIFVPILVIFISIIIYINMKIITPRLLHVISGGR